MALNLSKINTPEEIAKAIKNKKRTREETLALLAKIDVLKKQNQEALEEAINADPFWYFEPSTGDIPKKGRELLRKYLKEEDIPQRLCGQTDAFASEASKIGVFGGNQSGKSTKGAITGFIWATGEVPDALKGIVPESMVPKEFPQHIRVIAVDHKQFKNTVLETYRKWVPRSYLKNGKWKDSYSAEDRLLTLYDPKTNHQTVKGTIEFMTNSQEKESFQGPPKHGMIYDEEPRYDIYKENLARFTTAKKIKILFCMTPTRGMSWVSDLFLSDEADDTVESFQLTSVTNRKADLDVLDEICHEYSDDYEALKMRLLGEFVSLSGLVYGKLFDRSLHVIEPFPITKDYLCITGMDPHLVTPSAMVFLLLDREGNAYLDGSRAIDADTEQIKDTFWGIVHERGYRTGWSVADKSSNSTIVAFGGRNIFNELSRGPNAIPAMRTSEKYEGSIKAGVDDIKKRLKINERSGKPRFFIVNRPENKDLIHSFRTLERDTYANEEVSGPKDRIKEGKHHKHASMRYIFQYPLNWYPEIDQVPAPMHFDEACG